MVWLVPVVSNLSCVLLIEDIDVAPSRHTGLLSYLPSPHIIYISPYQSPLFPLPLFLLSLSFPFPLSSSLSLITLLPHHLSPLSLFTLIQSLTIIHYPLSKSYLLTTKNNNTNVKHYQEPIRY